MPRRGPALTPGSDPFARCPCAQQCSEILGCRVERGRQGHFQVTQRQAFRRAQRHGLGHCQQREFGGDGRDQRGR